MLRWLHELLFHSQDFTLGPESIRALAGPPPPPRAWERCHHCQTLVRGTHDCPKHPETLAVQRVRLRVLLVALEIHRAPKSRPGVVNIKTRRRRAA
jgi:hypothetical protein